MSTPEQSTRNDEMPCDHRELNDFDRFGLSPLIEAINVAYEAWYEKATPARHAALDKANRDFAAAVDVALLSMDEENRVATNKIESGDPSTREGEGGLPTGNCPEAPTAGASPDSSFFGPPTREYLERTVANTKSRYGAAIAYCEREIELIRARKAARPADRFEAWLTFEHTRHAARWRLVWAFGTTLACYSVLFVALFIALTLSGGPS